ncbi:IMPACT family protein [Elongatibacter sediminis]|uniref:YigZ family protein n=1 Tax=Elongatibacter sediminis TaxID=3119006 RepID=A0AAW9R6U0_9GAMM
MQTLAAPVSNETVVRHSRFVAHAGPIPGPDAATVFLESVADPAATHNCWAWTCDGACRFSDDGEPGGTAGRPILSAIEGKGLDRVMVVVTRYFGGIKLGAGGLVRAYGGAAARCIDQGRIITIHATETAVIECGFEWTGAVHSVLERCAARKLEESFTSDGIRLRIEVRADRLSDLEHGLRDSTRGSARLQVS